MIRQHVTALSSVIALLAMVPAQATAQGATPKTPWGHPDLQGTYTNKTTTPLQRPEDLADREFLTAEEVATREQAALARNADLLQAAAQKTAAGGNVGAYNNFWLDGGTRPTGRTSLIFEPANGRLPALTPAAERVRAAAREARHEADTWDDLELNDRCLIWQAGPPMLPSAYNNNFMIMQTPDYVAIQVEMIHDTRIIPLDGSAHLPDDVRQWMGDSRGHWEGNTLVVETTNFLRETSFTGSSANLHLLERFRRVDADTLLYEFTVTDPLTFVGPWTAQIPMKKSDGALFEYACHEGNYSLFNILSGARYQERREGGR